MKKLLLLLLLLAVPATAQPWFYIVNYHIDTAAELDTIVADENLIVATEIDTEAEIVALVSDLATILQNTDIDTEAEIVAIVSDLATILQNTDIDTSAELAAILGDETGTGALVFGTAPSITTSLTVGTLSDPADSGAIRLDNATSICWEADAAGTDVCLTVDSGEILQMSGGTIDGADLTAASVALAALAAGTDGQVITWDAAGAITAVGPGTDGQVLTSTGAGSPPAFEAAAGGANGSSHVLYFGTGGTAAGNGAAAEVMHCHVWPANKMDDMDTATAYVNAADADDAFQICVYSYDGSAQYFECDLVVTSTGQVGCSNEISTPAVPEGDVAVCYGITNNATPTARLGYGDSVTGNLYEELAQSGDCDATESFTWAAATAGADGRVPGISFIDVP